MNPEKLDDVLSLLEIALFSYWSIVTLTKGTYDFYFKQVHISSMLPTSNLL